MYYFHSGGTARTEALGINTGTTRGTSVPPSASNNVKGSWVDIGGTTSFTYEATGVILGDTNGIGVGCTADVGINVGGNRYIIAKDVRPCALTLRGNNEGRAYIHLPLHIPAGTQLSMRTQASTAAGSSIFASIIGFSHGVNGAPGYSKCIALSAITTSRGVAVDPGGVAHTKTRVELVASSAEAVAAVFAQTGPNNDTSRTAASRWLYDLEMGGSGSEQIILPNFSMCGGSTGDIALPDITPVVPCYAPAGTRFSVNAQSSSVTVGDRTFDMTLYGLTP